MGSQSELNRGLLMGAIVYLLSGVKILELCSICNMIVVNIQMQYKIFICVEVGISDTNLEAG